MITAKPGRYSLFCLLLFFTLHGQAQFFDSLSANAGLRYQLSTGDYQPLWMIANQFGTVTDRKSDLTSFIRVRNKNVLASSESQNDKGLYDYNDLSLLYGLSLYNNNHFRSTFVEEGYVKLEYKNWSLRAGRFEETTGDLDRDLSTGSLGVSANALPIPKIGIAVTDYTNVPFTNGWVQFKGSFAHGWLGDNRYVKNSYYHEKTFFLRFGPGDLKFYLGLEHFAEWGGTRGKQQFGRSMQDFRDVVFARETNATPELGTHGGDNRGVLDGGLYWETNNFSLHGYVQKPFEGMNDIGFGTLNGLAGFSVSLKDKFTGLKKFVVEVLNTKNSNSHIAVSQQESYYNNNIYKTGWEYQDNIIGTPLFINRARGADYFPGIAPFNWNGPDTIPNDANIINNRVFAIHAGALYSLTDRLDGKTLLTYTNNFGSSNYAYLFSSGKTEFYCLQQVSYDLEKYNLAINAGLGFDFGQLSHNDIIGITIGIEWNIPVRSQVGSY